MHFTDFQKIYQKITPSIQVTPLLESFYLSQIIDGKVFIKPESLQKTGSFKFRGALHRLMSLTVSESERGVVAYSSGNFAVGLAAAGQQLGVKVTLVIPDDAPKNKINQAIRYGATIIPCTSKVPSREEAAHHLAVQLSHDRNYVLLHPFNDSTLMHGQATVALELWQQAQEKNISINSVLCPTGGGSLVTGCALFFSSSDALKSQQVISYAIEPEQYNGMGISLANEKIFRAPGSKQNCLCDALMALSPGDTLFPTIVQCKAQGISVSKQYIIEAMKLAFNELKLILEPSGAIAIAAILQYPDKFTNQIVVSIASGGNIDAQHYKDLLFHEL